MAKIFFVMGKSASGKDTIYKMLAEDIQLNLSKIVLYTTRPMREGEIEGETYFFTNEDQLSEYEKCGQVIELRSYNTVYGVWKYFTLHDHQINENGNYIVIGTLESYEKYLNYFGKDFIYPIYIEVEDGTRLIRAIERERQERTPKYAEVCRRFLADTEDFAEDRILSLDITKRYENLNLEDCYKKIKIDILEQIKQ